MTDTHTHLYLPEFGGEGDGAVERAVSAGVRRLVMPCVDRTSVRPLLDLYARFPDNVYPAMGLHPTEVDSDWRDHLREIAEGFEGVPVVAIGEVGMDFYWDATHAAEQAEALACQIEMARNAGLPMIIHCREALEQTAAVFDDFGQDIPPAVFHSFTGSPADVERLRRTSDFYFGINGVVTFKSAAGLRESLPLIGIDRILLETDSPYLAPVPHRGHRNESSYLPHVAAKVAEVLGMSVAEVEAATDRNASRFFGLTA